MIAAIIRLPVLFGNVQKSDEIILKEYYMRAYTFFICQVISECHVRG